MNLELKCSGTCLSVRLTNPISPCLAPPEELFRILDRKLRCTRIGEDLSVCKQGEGGQSAACSNCGQSQKYWTLSNNHALPRIRLVLALRQKKSQYIPQLRCKRSKQLQRCRQWRLKHPLFDACKSANGAKQVHVSAIDKLRAARLSDCFTLNRRGC